MTELHPASEQELAALVAQAAAARRPLEIIGSGSKRALGRPVAADVRVDMSAFAGLAFYEPEELVYSAGPATPLAEAETALAAKGQIFAFEPPDLTRLLGTAPGTLGGLTAANLSGPRRLKAGALRDHLLGFSAVSGRGEIFKAGSRVMKNVTGYDLPKLMAGSWGTLACLTSFTFKVQPKPETELTLCLDGLTDERAITALTAAMQSDADISGAAHAAGAGTLLRLEGFTPSVEARSRMLAQHLATFGPARVIEPDASSSLWRDVRDGMLLRPAADEQIWRISTAPATAASTARALMGASGGRCAYDWAGGLIWLAMPPRADAAASALRAALAPFGGHAMLVRAQAEVRARVPVFQPQAPALSALTARVKQAFDPAGILNPGRMGEAI